MTVQGHSSPMITEVYAELDQAKGSRAHERDRVSGRLCRPTETRSTTWAGSTRKMVPGETTPST